MANISGIEKTAILSVLAVASWTIPPRFWRRFTLALAQTRPSFLSARRERDASRVPAFMTSLSGLNRRQIGGQMLSLAYEEAMQVFRVHRPGGWQPHIEVIGLEHLAEARRNGKGAIIWTSFSFQSLINKMALKSAGYPMHYLSRPEHGFYHYADRFKGIVLGAENRFLESRVVIEGDSAVVAMRRLVEILESNQTVGIAYGEQSSHLVRTPLFDGTLSVPTGPMNLSRLTGAPLIPSFTIQETSERFRVELAEPIHLDPRLSRQEQFEAGARQHASILEGYVRKYPLLWTGRLHVWRSEPLPNHASA